jgi:phosphoglycerate kinase
MERELDAIGDVGETPSPRAYVLGGAKVTDAIDVAQGVLDRGLADEVLTTGVVANVLFMARGVDIGEESVAFVEESVGREQVDRARALLDDHGDRVHLPRDVAVDDDGTRREVAVEDLPPAGGDPILDIGSTTVGYYRSVLDRVHTVVLNGPAGVFERDAFATGTRALFEAASEVDHSIVGGGDTAAAIRRLGVEGFNHVSTGGGAAMRILSGGSLPAVDVLDSGDTNGD